MASVPFICAGWGHGDPGGGKYKPPEEGWDFDACVERALARAFF